VVFPNHYPLSTIHCATGVPAVSTPGADRPFYSHRPQLRDVEGIDVASAIVFFMALLVYFYRRFKDKDGGRKDNSRPD